MKPDELAALLEAIARKHFPGAIGDPSDPFEISLREALREAYDAGADEESPCDES